MQAGLEDKLAIIETVNNWAVWRDAGDWERFRTVWHEDGWMSATWFQGPAEKFIEVSKAGFDKGVSILHFLGGSSVDLKGERAIAQTKMTISQRATVDGVPVDVVCTGRFYDFFAKRAGLPNPPQYYTNWAGSIGGPIRKDKTFFWFSTDDYKQRSTRNNVLTLPTALERAGDFSQTRNSAGQLVTIYDPTTTRTVNGAIVRDAFPGNVIPAERMSPVARAMLRAMPVPAVGKSLNGQATLDDGPQNQETLKVDQRWNDQIGRAHV